MTLHSLNTSFNTLVPTMTFSLRTQSIVSSLTSAKAFALGSALLTMSVSAYACNVPKSYYSNVSCTSNSSYFIALKDTGEPVALLNKQGKRVVNLFPYNAVDANKISEGLMPVQKKGRVGYINLSGREVIPPTYEPILNDQFTSGWARAASNGRIVVKKNGGFGIVDTRNKTILKPSSRYNAISDFSGGKAQVVKSTGTIWVDLNARPTASPNAASSNQTAQNTQSTNSQPISNQPAMNSQSTQPNRQPLSASTRQTPLTASPSHSTFGGVYQEIWQAEKRDGMWGFVNKSGIPMIQFTFDQVTPFSEGLAGVRMDNKWGFINLAGDLVVPFEFEESKVNRSLGNTYKGVDPFTFKEGKAWVGNTPLGAKMCINFEGKYISCD